LKRISFIIPSLKAGGGSERIITELANYASTKEEIEVHLVLLIKEERFYKLNDHVYVHEPDFDHQKYTRLFFTLKILKFLRRLIKEMKPDVVLSFEEMYNSFVLLALLFSKTKVFVSDRSQPDRYWGMLHKILKRLLYPTSYGMIAQTEIAKHIFYKQVFHNNIIVIPNPIRQVSKTNSFKENIILNVGRLVKSKQQDLLIEIFSKTEKEGWTLVIAGDGPEKDNLLVKCHELCLSEYVQFIGNVSNIDEYYYRSRIFAFTSNSEGFPNALGEAMAASCAVISFDCKAGPSELIHNDYNGYLIGEDDMEKYRICLQKLIDDNSLCNYFGKNARTKAEQYSIELIGESYLNTLLK